MSGSFDSGGQLPLMLITISRGSAGHNFTLLGEKPDQTLLISKIYKNVS
jgi:hypothetical protein